MLQKSARYVKRPNSLPPPPRYYFASIKFQLTVEHDEHKLVIESLSKLETERKAFRLIGGVLVERTVGEVLPDVTKNFAGVR